MKQTIGWILAIIVVFGLFFSVGALPKENRVYTTIEKAEAGECISLPINIENNTGLMGFVLYLTYDPQSLTPVSVTKNARLSGMFQDSIGGLGVQGRIKVLYSGTENITADGELFSITFELSETAVEKCCIQLEFSEEDTFDEEWNPVQLQCEEIVLTLSQTETTENETELEETEPVTEKETETTEPPVEPTTEPASQPMKKLSERIRAWLKTLPSVLRIVTSVFALPIAWVAAMLGN